MRFSFHSAKLLDFLGRARDLRKSSNPFAMVVLAQLESQNAKGDAGRYTAKFRLLRKLVEKDHERRDIIPLLRFIDWLYVLPPELDAKLDRSLQLIGTRKAMPYVTSWERNGIRKGRKEGRKEGIALGSKSGLLEALELGLELRFGKRGLALMPQLRKISDVAKLRALTAAIRHVKKLAEFSKVAGPHSPAR